MAFDAKGKRINKDNSLVTNPGISGYNAADERCKPL